MLLIVELNEFNVDLLENAVAQYSLPALARILSYSRSQYKTPDRYNSGYLEPWVQWVSIHAGIPSVQHRIKHLGEIPSLQFEQCWETLSKQNVTCGIWGVMNGSKRQASQVKFFLPDPWTFSEQAFPKALNHLLDLPRYVAKNYQQMRKGVLVGQGLKLLKFILTSGVGSQIVKESFQLLKFLRQYGKKHFVYICYFDYISTLLFTRYQQKFSPQCSFLFLNSLAHLQHHYWHDKDGKLSPEILFGLKYLDRLFAHLFQHFPTDAFVIHNGLSQMNTNHEKPWVLYRQKNPLAFLHALNIPATKVEQHMTHDGNVFFATAALCESAYSTLKHAKMSHKALFQVEKCLQDPCQLFYQLAFTDDLTGSEPLFVFAGKEYKFFDYFDKIVTRTGRHIPIGTIFSSHLNFPDHIYNHDFNRYLFNYLKPIQFPLREAMELENLSEPV